MPSLKNKENLITLTLDNVIFTPPLSTPHLLAFLNEFEKSSDDLSDALTTDIESCFTKTTTNGSTTYTPTTVQGKTCQSLLGKKEINLFMQLVSPLDAMPAILPGFLELAIQLAFAKDKRIFTCTSATGAKPTLRFKVNKAIYKTKSITDEIKKESLC